MHISLLNNQPQWVAGTVFFIDKDTPMFANYIEQEQESFIRTQIALDKKLIPLFTPDGYAWAVVFNKDTKPEDYRKLGHDLATAADKEKTKALQLDGNFCDSKHLLAFVEGFVLSAYRFVKYFKETEKTKKTFQTTQLDIYHPDMEAAAIESLQNTLKAVYWTRNMVNEPVNFMNAPRFAKEVAILGQESGFRVEILDKKKIESLKMGGLLAVNKGSIDPPTFTICEWKPPKAINNKPFVLVGKGVMYDTGGLSLKPTANSMDLMKSDMAGAAAVAGNIYATALNKLPVWVIALLPATDNRPDGNAYAPGDIIKMHNGLHVEVMNSDAEGRMILADALSYGDKFNPQLVIDMATLTGSAAMALGPEAALIMGNADDKYMEQLIQAGYRVHERLVRFPFWDEYAESLKSVIADIKNLGKREAGAISAGKFLEHFTNSPYIHLDIAGPAFLTSNDSYRSIGGTGYGVRLMLEFFKNISNTQ